MRGIPVAYTRLTPFNYVHLIMSTAVYLCPISKILTRQDVVVCKAAVNKCTVTPRLVGGDLTKSSVIASPCLTTLSSYTLNRCARFESFNPI